MNITLISKGVSMRVVSSFICLSLIFLGMSCTKSKTPLTLLTESYPPLTFAVGDSISGYGAEVVQAMQQQLKTCYTPQLLTWDKAYQRALNEPNIVIFTMEKTPERDSLFYWVGPLGENITSFYTYKESKIKLTNLEDAKKLKAIATTTAWFSEQYLIRQGFTNLVSSEKPSESVKQVISRRADVGVLTDLTSKQIIQSAGYLSSDLIPVLEITRTEYYIGISKQTDPAIVDKWQAAFSAIKANGILSKIKAKWFPE